MFRRLVTLALAGVVVVVLLPGGAHAIIIYNQDGTDGFSGPRHDRFYTGPDKDFFAADLNLTGVSRGPSQNSSNLAFATLISARHILTAEHLRPNDGEGVISVTFFRGDSRDSEIWEGEIELGSYTRLSNDLGRADLRVGRLTETPPEWVRRYPLVRRQYADPEINYNVLAQEEVDPKVYLVGRGHRINDRGRVRGAGGIESLWVGVNTIDVTSLPIAIGPRTTYAYTFSRDDENILPDEALLFGGDSSGPTFVKQSAAGSALSGIHLARGAGSGALSVVSGFDVDLAHYVDDIRAIVEQAGESINVVTDLAGDVNGDFVVNEVDAAIVDANLGVGGGLVALGDANLDGQVDAADQQIVADALGSSLVSPVDFNRDFSVDGEDFAEIATRWLQAAPVDGAPLGDANGDGQIDLADVAVFASFWVSEPNRPTPLSRIAGDANLDGIVNAADLRLVEESLGQDINPNTGSDFNGDGQVTTEDLQVVADNVFRVFGDLDGDFDVDLNDVGLLADLLQTSVSGGAAEGDLDGDGFVDEADLAALGFWWRPRSAAPNDYNGDGLLNVDDFAAWVAAFGSITTVTAAGTGADGNADTLVNAADFVVLRDQLGVSLVSPAVVPEPTGVALLGFAGLWTVWTCRRRSSIG